MFVTRSDNPWPLDEDDRRNRNWTLDVKRHICTRKLFIQGHPTYDTIINVRSQLARQITRILDPIESPEYMLIFQPAGDRKLSVELTRQQLLFQVNDAGLLQSPQLQSEVDPSQDIGTWYGLTSKLVCWSTTSSYERTVLVPVGRLHAKADGCHVQVHIETSEGYGRYRVNSVLGRLDCAAEPLLIYHKALIHAHTSFVLPDTLTGRTGSDEAIEWLQSGICQPWQPLTRGSVQKLHHLASLTPVRTYYPPELRSLKTDHWDDSIPTTLQNSLFWPLVQKIILTSDALDRFSQDKLDIPDLAYCGPPELQRRARVRQSVHGKLCENLQLVPKALDMKYSPRDRPASHNLRQTNVREVVSLLKKKPQRISTTAQLSNALANIPIIYGFGTKFDSMTVQDHFVMDIKKSWGPLVQWARTVPNLYGFMLQLSVISFRTDVDLALVRTIVSFYLYKDLRELQPPTAEQFENFQPHRKPEAEHLSTLLKPFEEPPPADHRSEFLHLLSAKEKKKYRIRMDAYEKEVQKDKEYLINHLLGQWPCHEPTAEGLDRLLLLYVEAAVAAISPEWRRLFVNMRLDRYLLRAQVYLDRRAAETRATPILNLDTREPYSRPRRACVTPSLAQLLKYAVALPEENSSPDEDIKVSARQMTRVPPRSRVPNRRDLPVSPVLPLRMGQVGSSEADIGIELENMLARLAKSRSIVKQQYAEDLSISLRSFASLPSTTTHVERDNELSNMTSAYVRVQKAVDSLQISLTRVGGSSKCASWLQKGDLWPTMTKAALLGRLSSTYTHEINEDVRRRIIGLGVSITILQRELRLETYRLKNDSGRLMEELDNEGHHNWNPSEYSDWLLLEIESNVMIRDVQVEVAKATISPQGGANSLLQMNMGQGRALTRIHFRPSLGPYRCGLLTFIKS